MLLIMTLLYWKSRCRARWVRSSRPVASSPAMLETSLTRGLREEAEGERTSRLIRIPVRGVKFAETPDKTKFRHVSCITHLATAYHKGHGDVREHPPHLLEVLPEAGVGPVVHHQARVVTHGPVRHRVTCLQTQGIYISDKNSFRL